MKNKVLAVVLSMAMSISMLSGCSSGAEPAAPAPEPEAEAEAEEEPQESEPEEAAAGEDYYIEWADQQWGLSAEEIEQVKALNLSFAIETPTESEFGYGQMRGFEDACEALGIKVAGETACGLDPAVQQANMENFISMGVDGIVCQPQDADTAASRFDPVVEAGIKLAFTGSHPDGYSAGEQYVTEVTDEFAKEGELAADYLAEAIGGKGKILAIKISSVNYVSNTRDNAFIDAINEKYPDIELAEVGGIESASDAASIASGLLARHPDADGMFVTFSTPALEVLDIVKSLGMEDFKIVTIDLDTVCCLDMINGGNIAGIVCDSAYYYAAAAVVGLAKDFLGQEVPGELAGPGKQVTLDNMREMWQWSFGTDVPDDLSKALEGIGK